MELCAETEQLNEVSFTTLRQALQSRRQIDLWFADRVHSIVDKMHFAAPFKLLITQATPHNYPIMWLLTSLTCHEGGPTHSCYHHVITQANYPLCGSWPTWLLAIAMRVAHRSSHTFQKLHSIMWLWRSIRAPTHSWINTPLCGMRSDYMECKIHFLPACPLALL
jgi:hypothetical protein